MLRSLSIGRLLIMIERREFRSQTLSRVLILKVRLLVTNSRRSMLLGAVGRGALRRVMVDITSNYVFSR